MGMIGKLRNRVQIGKGRARVAIGRAKGDRHLVTKGHADRVAGAAKQIGEHAKDAGKSIRRTLRK